MGTFFTCLINVVVSLCFIIPGYILCKLKRVSANHLSSMSTILVYVCGPCMVIYSFYNASIQADKLGISKVSMGLQMLYFGIATLLLQILALLILYLIFKKKFQEAKYRILTAGSVFGNVGFFGLPLVMSLIDNPIAGCYSSIFVLTMNILIFTVGVFCITNDKKYMSIKEALINPTTIALLIAIPAFIFGSKISNDTVNVFAEAINLLGKMTTPLCMLILGIRLATVSFKGLWIRPMIY